MKHKEYIIIDKIKNSIIKCDNKRQCYQLVKMLKSKYFNCVIIRSYNGGDIIAIR